MTVSKNADNSYDLANVDEEQVLVLASIISKVIVQYDSMLLPAVRGHFKPEVIKAVEEERAECINNLDAIKSALPASSLARMDNIYVAAISDLDVLEPASHKTH